MRIERELVERALRFVKETLRYHTMNGTGHGIVYAQRLHNDLKRLLTQADGDAAWPFDRPNDTPLPKAEVPLQTPEPEEPLETEPVAVGEAPAESKRRRSHMVPLRDRTVSEQ
jgi:hypothetical protein